ncbi:MAG TPA: hypothetical protein VGI10_13170 [Polyangiaceae bacterium]|jgi:hypothetical protein
MSDTHEKQNPDTATELPSESAPRAKRTYEPPTCEKKRSIHRVTLLSGMGVAGMGAISMTN